MSGSFTDLPEAVDARKAILRDFDRLSGRELLERILHDRNPAHLVRELPDGDFFWLVKKIGADDSLPVLELATVDQWQHLIDMDVWERDEVLLDEALTWLKRLFEADPRRTVLWVLAEGNPLAHFIFMKTLEVLVREEEEKDFEIPEGFFSFDGVLYLHALNDEFEPFLREITAAIAGFDIAAFTMFMTGLASVVSTELEEGMHRMRSVRLAEHGFLPFEEALHLYSPLRPEEIEQGGGHTVLELNEEPQTALIPFLPFQEAGQSGFLHDVFSRIRDPLLLDRLRLEFAGIVNQVIALEGLSRAEMETLYRMTGKAAGLIAIALQTLTEGDADRARDIVERNSLTSIFRTGFGVALSLRQGAERWIASAWFRQTGFDRSFWGDQRDSLLTGILRKRPVLYAGTKKGDLYRDFLDLADIAEAKNRLEGLSALDRLLSLLSSAGIDESIRLRDDLTFEHFLLTFWARLRLGLPAPLAAITPAEARAFFSQLREGETAPPYRMGSWGEIFLEDLMERAAAMPAGLKSVLERELREVWVRFREEYEDVPPADTDMKHTPFLMIE